MDCLEALKVLVAGRSLSRDEMQDVMRLIMAGTATEAQMGAILGMMAMRGETVAELTGAVAVLRELVDAVPVQNRPVLDTCGTGGSGAKLFNISTAAAFIVAGGGQPVAKHGNRAMSGSSGSADLFELAGANLELSAAQVGQCIDRVGMGFMFAPAHHKAVRHAGAVRAQLAVRTLFNLIGPMANPACAEYQVLGVPAERWQMPLAEVLRALGSKAVMVVHSQGLDELGIAGPSLVVELKAGEIRRYEITPESVGLKTQSHAGLVVESPEQSLKLLRAALSDPDSAAASIVALNAGAALYTAGVVNRLSWGVEMAQDLIASGQAREKMSEFIAFTKLLPAMEAEHS